MTAQIALVKKGRKAAERQPRHRQRRKVQKAAVTVTRPVTHPSATMPRKKVARPSSEQTKAIFDRLLAPTMQAWQERERAIEWLCRLYGADSDNELHRHMVFGLLAWFVPPYLRPDRRGSGRLKGISADDREIIERVLTKVKSGKQILRDALTNAIKEAERKGQLLAYLDRTTNKKRLMRKIREHYAQKASNAEDAGREIRTPFNVPATGASCPDLPLPRV